IGHAIDSYVTSFGYSTVKVLVGHGIGKNLHEMPDVPNYGKAGRGLRIVEGMALAIEPMVNMGTDRVDFLDDGWTCVTIDGKPSAHYENTLVVTKDGCEILTL
ncbi:MAG: M24 family metallopeptidase, partial [Clostridia bacterium]|nr:M24 family metallopeptidase [Clostridia bacterium]